jgi:hypothetical protein
MMLGRRAQGIGIGAVGLAAGGWFMVRMLQRGYNSSHMQRSHASSPEPLTEGQARELRRALETATPPSVEERQLSESAQRVQPRERALGAR